MTPTRILDVRRANTIHSAYLLHSPAKSIDRTCEHVEWFFKANTPPACLASFEAEQRVLFPLSVLVSEEGALVLSSLAAQRGLEDQVVSLIQHAAQQLLDSPLCDTVPTTPAIVLFVPGRIEVAGKHTDYCGGRSLLCVINRCFVAVMVPREDRMIHIVNVDIKDALSFELSDTICPSKNGSWANYPMTAARRLAGNFGHVFGSVGLRGMDLALSCNIPPASGMSTSSALITTVATAIITRNRLSSTRFYRDHLPSRLQVCEYFGCIENGQSYGMLKGDAGVGTFGGSEDHTAMLMCEQGALSCFSFCPIKAVSRVTFPPSLTFVVGVSGYRAEKTAGAQDAYNKASLMAKYISQLLSDRRGDSDPRSLATQFSGSEESMNEVLDTIKAHCPARDAPLSPVTPFYQEDLCDRFYQFFIETEQCVPLLSRAIADNDVAAMRDTAQLSMALATTHLKTQVSETISLTNLAYENGAIAASAFGAGFGGSVWAIVERTTSDEFLKRWRDDYIEYHPNWKDDCVFFKTLPGPGVFQFVRGNDMAACAVDL